MASYMSAEVFALVKGFLAVAAFHFCGRKQLIVFAVPYSDCTSRHTGEEHCRQDLLSLVLLKGVCLASGEVSALAI